MHEDLTSGDSLSGQAPSPIAGSHQQRSLLSLGSGTLVLWMPGFPRDSRKAGARGACEKASGLEGQSEALIDEVKGSLIQGLFTASNARTRVQSRTLGR